MGEIKGKRRWPWLVAMVISLAIAIEELIGWEIKKASYGDGMPAGLAERLQEHDMPNATLIEFITVSVFLGLAYLFWRKSKNRTK